MRVSLIGMGTDQVVVFENVPHPVTYEDLQSMYQREALWLSFSRDFVDCAVKISVGGVNALTGLPHDQPAPPKIQDYLPVNSSKGQM